MKDTNKTKAVVKLSGVADSIILAALLAACQPEVSHSLFVTACIIYIQATLSTSG